MSVAFLGTVRSWCKTQEKRDGASVNPCGIIVQVYCWFFQGKMNQYWFSLSAGIPKKAERRSTTVIHFTLDDKVLRFGTTGNLSITILIARRSWTYLQPCPFGFLMGNSRAIQGVVLGILSPCLVKSSVVGKSPSVDSGLIEYWDNLGRGLEWSISIFMGSALLILPLSVEDEARRHSGTSERSGLSHFPVSISSSPAWRKQSSSGHFSS